MPLNMIYLFVLASKQGVLRPEKTIKSPLPSSPSLSARAHTLPCVLSQRLCYASQRGERSMQQLIVLKQYTSLARGPKGWTLLLQLSGKWGWIQARKAPPSKPIDTCITTRAPRGCLLNSSLETPDRAVRACRGKVRCSPGSQAEIESSPIPSGARRAAGFGPTMLSETTPAACWCGSKSLCFSQLFAVGLQRMI